MYRFTDHNTPTGERCPLSYNVISDPIAESKEDSGRCWDNCPDSAIEQVPEPAGLMISRSQLQEWAGRPLSDDDLERLTAAVPYSSIPEAIGVIVDSLPRSGPAQLAC